MHTIYSLDDGPKQDVSIHRNHTPLHRGTLIHMRYPPAGCPLASTSELPYQQLPLCDSIPRLIAILHSYKYMQILQAHTLISIYIYQHTILHGHATISPLSAPYPTARRAQTSSFLSERAIPAFRLSASLGRRSFAMPPSPHNLLSTARANAARSKNHQDPLIEIA